MNSKINHYFISFILFSAMAFIGCGSEEGFSSGDTDTVSPTATVSPLDRSSITTTDNIVITFSESMDTNSKSIGGDLSSEAVSTWSKTEHENDTLTISPSTEWSYGSDLSLTVTCNDSAGNSLKNGMLTMTYSISDISGPTAEVSPLDRSSITTTDNIVIKFSESMDTNSTSIGGDLSSEADLTWSKTEHENDTLTISPSTEWSYGSDFSLYVNCKDLAGNTLKNGMLTLTYSILEITDPTAEVSPANGSSLDRTADIVITFSESIDTGSFSTGRDLSAEATVTWSSTTYGNDTVTISPIQGWNFGENFTLNINCEDLSGNKMEQLTLSYPISDSIAPTASINHESGSLLNGSDTIVLTFSESMDTSTCSLSGDLSSIAESTWTTATYENDTLTISPSSLWPHGVDSSLSIDCQDLYGNAMEQLTVSYTIWSGTQILGSTETDMAAAIVTDSMGSLYITGTTYGSLDGNIDAGQGDVFLAKYNSAGEKQWTHQSGTAECDTAYAAAIDNSGSIYITGSTRGNFGDAAHAGDEDMFLAKYSPDGTREWSRQLGSSARDRASGVAADSSGNIYVTGHTLGNLDGIQNTNSLDIFLVKYNSTGTKLWTKLISSMSISSKIVIDSLDNIYIADGYYSLSLTKFNSDGEMQWTQESDTGAATIDLVSGMVIDSSGNIYFTGFTNGVLDGNTNAGNYDIFLAKYNSDGEKQWTRQLGTEEEDRSSGVALDSSGDLYISGFTKGGFDGNTLSGQTDTILAKYDSSGVKQWTSQLDSDSSDQATGIVIDNSDNIFVAGYASGSFNGAARVGPIDAFLVMYNISGKIK
ncbi:MAG: hypothetical protein GY754_15905 [bacterium]|nr:hypothetical protein [bacterium]